MVSPYSETATSGLNMLAETLPYLFGFKLSERAHMNFSVRFRLRNSCGCGLRY